MEVKNEQENHNNSVPIIIILITLVYYKPIKVYDIITPYTTDTLPTKINAAIYFSAPSFKELEVTGEESIKELVKILESIELRKLLFHSDTFSYTPKLKETYRLELYGANIQSINILNSKYLEIDHDRYRIVGKSDISNIYDIIILDHPEGELDDFYYKLITD